MTTVLAYLDPGSGSMILQILAGGVAAVAVTAKLYWNRVLRFLRIRKDEPETAETPARQEHRLRLATAGRPPAAIRHPSLLFGAARAAARRHQRRLRPRARQLS